MILLSMKISVRVKPNAKKIKVEKIEERVFSVWVDEPPSKGRANKRLIEILSDYFKVPKRSVRIVKGETSRNKIIEIEGL